MTSLRIRLVAGLGNPGNEYAETRHNAGFMVVDEIADAFSIRVREVGEIQEADDAVPIEICGALAAVAIESSE